MAIDSNGKNYENRTLQFYGAAYGDSNVSLTATINGDTVFSGEVPTINSPMPLSPIDLTSVLFSIDNSVLFPTNWQGSLPMSITVTGGNGVLLNAIRCNYMPALAGDTPIPGNATAYFSCYENGIPINSEDTPDPRSSVTIDGVSQVPPLPPSQGVWTWIVPNGSTIAYNLNISLGNCAQA